MQLMYCFLFLALLALHWACHLLFCSALLSIVRGKLLKHFSEMLGHKCPGKSSCVGPLTHPPTWQTSFVKSIPQKSQQKDHVFLCASAYSTSVLITPETTGSKITPATASIFLKKTVESQRSKWNIYAPSLPLNDGLHPQWGETQRCRRGFVWAKRFSCQELVVGWESD